MASRLAATRLNYIRLDDHTGNYGEDSYNEALLLERINVVVDT